MLMLGRAMVARHADVCEGIPVTGPRFLLLRHLADHPSKAGELAAQLGREGAGDLVADRGAGARRARATRARLQTTDEWSS